MDIYNTYICVVEHSCTNIYGRYIYTCVYIYMHVYIQAGGASRALAVS